MTDSTQTFGGIDQLAPGATTCCITYGVHNDKALRRAGFRSILWIRFGTIAAELDKVISASLPLLEHIELFYLDQLKPEYDAEITRRISPERVRRIKYPEPYHGADQILNGDGELPALGAVFLRKLVEQAKPVPVAGVYEPDEVWDSVMEAYEQGLPPGCSLGFSGLTMPSGKEIYTIATPSLNVFTGYYGSGKSEFIENIEIEMARTHGWKFAVFNPETQPPSIAMANLAEKYIGKPFSKEVHFDRMGNARPRMEKDELLHARQFIQEHFRFILPKEKNFTIDDIITASKRLVKDFGIKGLIIDPFNQVEYNKPKDMREDIYIGQCMMKLNILKRQHDLWICVAAHPKTPQPNRNGEYPIPSIMALAGGMTFGNMIDFGVAIHRNKLDTSEPVQVHVQKVKFKNWGRLEVGYLQFDLATSRYKDAKDDDGNTIFAGHEFKKKR